MIIQLTPSTTSVFLQLNDKFVNNNKHQVNPSSGQLAASCSVASESMEALERRLARIHAHRREHLASKTAEEKERHLATHNVARCGALSTSEAHLKRI